VCRTCCTIISSSEVIRPLVSQYTRSEAALSGLDRQATVRFFPHEVSDLAVALEFAQILNRAQSSTLWSTQHVALLWISLICMIPFDLAQFDEVGREGQTAAIIEAIAKQSLATSGIVRDSAAILLSRLYVRYQICKVSYPLTQLIAGGMCYRAFRHSWTGPNHVQKNRKTSSRYIILESLQVGLTQSVLLPVSWGLPDALRSDQE
jgi:hypothetical protein